MRSLLIAHTAHAPESVRGDSRWLFLDQRYLELLRWKRALGRDPLPLGPRLNAVAHRMRMPFLRTMAALGRTRDSLGWWVSRLSERNPMVSPLFIRCCYLAAALEILKEDSEDLLIISDSVALLDSIAREAASRGWTIERLAGMPRPRVAWLSLLRIGSFLWRWMRAPRGPKSRIDGILMRTWLDESSFGADGTLRDRYFPRLAAWLESRGRHVTLLPVLMNLDRSEHDAWRWLRNSGRSVLDPRALYGIGDVLGAIVVCASQVRMSFDGVRIADTDVTALFEEERRDTLFEGGSLEAALWFALPRHLARRGDRVDLLLDLYENMITEKPLTAGMRAFLPKTPIVSFQHAIPTPLLVSIFVTPEEAAFAPLADRVVTSGEFFTRILIDAGLQADRVVDGPALRYEYLTQPAAAVTGDAVLLALPLPHSDAVELLVKAYAALAGDKAIHVLVKPHPMSDLNSLLRLAAIDSLPASWEVVGGELSEVMKRARVVVTIGGSTAFEAIASGAMVVVVGRDAALDLNPLQWFPSLQRSVYEPHELRAEVQRLLAAPADKAAEARDMLRATFNPVNDATLEAFLLN